MADAAAGGDKNNNTNAGKSAEKALLGKSVSEPSLTLTKGSLKGMSHLGLNPERGDSWTQNTAPGYSIRTKLAFGDPLLSKEVRPGCQTYKIKDVTHHGVCYAPKWSMTTRGSGIPKAPPKPGPGQYEIPGTCLFEHPLVSHPGSIPFKRTEKRAEPQDWDRADETPAPGYYKVNFDGKMGTKLQNKEPAYTMRIKPSDPADREKRPGCQTYSPLPNVTCKGVQKLPSWSLTARGSGITKPPNQPGPGEYAIPGTIYGGHPAFTTPGRVAIPSQRRSDPKDQCVIYPTRPY